MKRISLCLSRRLSLGFTSPPPPPLAPSHSVSPSVRPSVCRRSAAAQRAILLYPPRLTGCMCNAPPPAGLVCLLANSPQSHPLFGIANMFKKFEEGDISTTVQLKSSVQKSIKQKLVEQFPNLANHADVILPKKEQLRVAKCPDHIEILVNSLGTHLFYRQREGQYFPSLRLVHQFPDIAPTMQVDRGAIKFVLSGANIMCPGLTSPGGLVPDGIESEQVVTIMAEDKQYALAIGLTKMSGHDIKTINKGIAVESIHYLNDGLWRAKPVK